MKVIYVILSFISYHLAHLQLQMDKLIYHAIDQPFVHKRYWIIHHQSGLKKRIHFHTHDLSLPYNYNDDLLLCTNVCSSRVNLFIYGRSNLVNLSKCKITLSFLLYPAKSLMSILCSTCKKIKENKHVIYRCTQIIRCLSIITFAWN